MTSKTGIARTKATWNPVAGCSVVSPDCTHCYAMVPVVVRIATFGGG
jgi:protein gp37